MDRFGEMGRADVFFIRQVGNRPGDLERAVVRPGAEAKPVDGRLEELLPVPVDPAELLDVLRPHLGIGINPPPSNRKS